MDQHEDIWLVQLANGATRAMTLDELDAAFQEGIIDEDTFVRRDGATKWSRLRDELGESEPAAPAPAPVPMQTYAPPAPVVSYGAVPSYPASSSIRPVVSELDSGEFASPFAKKSKKPLFIGGGLAVAAAVAIAAFGATKLGNAPAASVNASVVNAVQAPQAPQAVTPPPPADPQPVAKPALNDDVKKALAAKDTQFNQKMDQKKKDRASKAANMPTRGKTSPPPFCTGGSAYDPLNAKL